MGRLAEDSWLPYAKRLDEGERKYVDHTCGGGRTLVVSAGDSGWSGYCFRCGDNGYVGYGIRPIADLGIIRKKEIAYAKATTCRLPEDFTYGIPKEHYVWLSKNSISSDMVRMYNVGWSAALSRIILPVYSMDGRLLFTQARAVESWRKPKYLNQGELPKTRIAFDSQCGQDTQREYEYGDVCCICEDIASAMRVGLYVRTYSFFGTSMSAEQASIISSRHTCALIWYDDDKAGIAGALNVQRGLRMLNVDSKIIRTSKDPKLYPNRLIAEALSTGEISGRNRPYYPTHYEGEGVVRKDVLKSAIGLFR